VEVARGTGLVPRRHDLHGRDVQGQGEDHLRQGATLEDPAGLFNASLDGNTRRAIDLHDADDLDEEAFTSLVRAAVALNASTARR
jgi:hypothetical protein